MRRGRTAILWLLLAIECIAGCASAPATPPVPALTPPTSATAGATTIVAIAPPAAPPQPSCTLPGFLGLDKLGQGIGGLFRRVFSRVRTMLGLEGKFPGLQPKPPLLPITDPANLSPDAPPAVKAAAEVKQEEDAAAQKVMALRYLATIGCGGCYPSVEDALLAALDDCTEAVRYEAVVALRGNGGTKCCAFCKCGDCCSPKVRQKLDEISYKMDDKGCYKEPSERVRRLARLALAACGGYTPDQATTPTEGPEVVPIDAPPTEGPTPAPLPVPIAPPTPAPPAPAPPAAANQPTLAPPLVDTKKTAPAAVVPVATETPAAKKSDVAGKSPLLSVVHLVAFEQAIEPAPGDPLLADVNGERIYESRVLPLVNDEISRLKSQGVAVDPRRFQQLLQAQVEKAVDVTLLLQQVRIARLQAAGNSFAPGGAPAVVSPEEVAAWLDTAVVVDERISLLELNAYYQEHARRYESAPQVKWEQVSVSVRRAGSREAAVALIQYLRSRAMGVDAEAPDMNLQIAETCTCDEATRTFDAPPLVRKTVVALPVGTVSPVLDAGDSLHVVRVLERRLPGTASFDQVEAKMRSEILAERRKHAEAALVRKLREQAQVWTVFSAPNSGPAAASSAALPPSSPQPELASQPAVVRPAAVTFPAPPPAESLFSAPALPR